MGFSVLPGAKLVFDIPEVELGPNAEVKMSLLPA